MCVFLTFFKKVLTNLFVINKTLITKRRVMKKLEELKSMLYVVDMVNGFLKEGNMKDERMMHIVVIN